MAKVSQKDKKNEKMNDTANQILYAMVFEVKTAVAYPSYVD